MKELSRRDFLKVFALGTGSLIISACGDPIKDSESRKTSVAYFSGEVLVPQEITLKKLPRENAEDYGPHPEYYLAFPIAWDSTGEGYKAKNKGGNKDNLWLGFMADGKKFWLKWSTVSQWAVNLRGENDNIPDILFGEPGDKPDEIKTTDGKIIKMLAYIENL